MKKLLAFIIIFALSFLGNGACHAQSAFMEYGHILSPEQPRSISEKTKAFTQFESNTESEVYRIRYDVPTSIGKFIAVFEKLKEKTDNRAGSGSYDDSVYILGFITKIANVYAKPLLVYR